MNGSNVTCSVRILGHLVADGCALWSIVVCYIHMKISKKGKNDDNHKNFFVIVYETLVFHTISRTFNIFHADLNEVKFE